MKRGEACIYVTSYYVQMIPAQILYKQCYSYEVLSMLVTCDTLGRKYLGQCCHSSLRSTIGEKGGNKNDCCC